MDDVLRVRRGLSALIAALVLANLVGLLVVDDGGGTVSDAAARKLLTGSEAITPEGSALTETTPTTAPLQIGAAGKPTPGPATAASGALGANPTSAATVAGAGIGTAEALANPRCDRATGRIKVPIKYAPACVRPWAKGMDNGGSTAPGVTAEEITFVVVAGGANVAEPKGDDAKNGWTQGVALWQHAMETWGRKVKLVMVDGGDTADEARQRALALQVAALKPFAVHYPIDYLILGRELAARKIIAVNNTGGSFNDSQALAGFLWSSYYTATENAMASTAEYAGKRLVGRPAKWAGDATYQAQTRTFGLVYPANAEPKLFMKEFDRWAVKLTESIAYQPTQFTTYQERVRTVIAKMKEKGVTTIVNGADLTFNAVLTREASVQLYNPEWLIIPYSGLDWAPAGSAYDTNQWSHAFGVGLISPANSYWAPRLWQWYYGPGAECPICGGQMNDLLFLFSGIMLAGPQLTPANFKAAKFAETPAGGFACGCVNVEQYSFGKWGGTPGYDDYWAIDDFAEIWWDPQSRNFLGTVGTYRFVNDGKRVPLGGWPTGEPPAFDKSKAKPDAELLDVVADHTPNYPCEGCPSSR